MTRAYVIAQATVTNPEQYEGYKALAGAAVAHYGGKYIVRGGATHLTGFRPAMTRGLNKCLEGNELARQAKVAMAGHAMRACAIRSGRGR